MTLPNFLIIRQRIKQPLMSRNMMKPVTQATDRRYLVELFRQDILDVQDLIGRGLSAWLAVTGEVCSARALGPAT